MRSGQDRRSHPRSPCHVRCILYFDGSVYKGIVLDLSESGVLVASDAPVGDGDTLLLRFHRPQDSAVVQIQGMVARTEVTTTVGQPAFGAQLFELLSTVPAQTGTTHAFPTAIPATASVRAGSLDDPSVSLELRARECRHIHSVTVLYSPAAGGGAQRLGDVINVSRTGLFLQSQEIFESNILLDVAFRGVDVDGEDRPLRMSVKVMWNGRGDPRDTASYGMGCRIVDSPDEDGWTRWQLLQKNLLMIGNPLFRRSLADD